VAQENEAEHAHRTAVAAPIAFKARAALIGFVLLLFLLLFLLLPRLRP